MACQYYAVRMLANLYAKNFEHPIAKFAKKRQKNGEFVPAPTAISRYHFMDESFHTTISGLVAKDLYREFNVPNSYEKFVSNSIFYRMQTGILGGLSAVSPFRFYSDDCSYIELVYDVLRSPIFRFSASEAKHWLRRCLCEEHDGLHAGTANRQRLLKHLNDFFSPIDYLWKINREMGVMANRGSIEATLKMNGKTCEQYLASANVS